ncbi:LysM peptidoglycan-binding domain-containing protein [Desulfotomaculum copahuensis]|uniref:Cell wall hydrolase n=1 Tax=Desulfotomaculum copahuensis TaxID=1838280 RepID=A0A1B7LIK7_9FIRM|nr:LysM peptidoglycan-binding domain-containing protein [Desulfotomaculum copahuensis]OAT86397.1 cell wall hydrolase [Desulfotomaculum copahuensis]
MRSLSFSLRCALATVAAFLLLPAGIALAATCVVNPGDSLYTISCCHGTTVEALRSANGLTTDMIYPGQKLIIPGENSSRSSVQESRYTVQPGDTLYSIGRRYGVDYQSIINANGLSGTSLYPGQTLLIPAAGSGRGTAGPAQVSRGALFRGPVSYDRSDFDLLARLITAEADNQSFTTQVAVGAVVLNRARSDIFPHSIPGVIYQVDDTGSYQFEPVLNGWINRPASLQAQKAALAALNGEDPTHGALYFFDSWVTNPWLQSRPNKQCLDDFTFTS